MFKNITKNGIACISIKETCMFSWTGRSRNKSIGDYINNLRLHQTSPLPSHLLTTQWTKAKQWQTDKHACVCWTVSKYLLLSRKNLSFTLLSNPKVTTLAIYPTFLGRHCSLQKGVMVLRFHTKSGPKPGKNLRSPLWWKYLTPHRF